MKTKTIVGLIGMVGFAGLLLFNFGSQVGGYMNFEQAAKTNARAHVVGTWAEDRPTRYDRTENVFSFYMKDESGTVHKVRYTNPKPANFEEAEQLVVEGRVEGEAFVADNILVKCPSKYNEMEGIEQADRRASNDASPRTGRGE